MSVLVLPGILDTAAATPLHRALLDRVRRRAPLVLDGAEVIRVGQACLQVIASAAATAEAHGLAFTLQTPSEALCETVTLARLESIFAPIDAKADR